MAATLSPTGAGPSALWGTAVMAGNANLLVYGNIGGFIPLSIVGKTGTIMTVIFGNALTLTGASWQTGNLTFVNMTLLNAITTATAMGTDNRTIGGGGTVQLITSLVITVLGAPSTSVVSLNLTYSAPEPGTMLLLGSGIAGLVVIGRRKIRS